ncbi:MAG: DUF4019 domain-containing protein, partial [Desulfuromonadales bacterium]|nr:DUF4019 domain-containing protein [Desulfuromonadales bacterium]
MIMIIVPMIGGKVDPEKAKAARASSERFFQLIDTGGYAESWKQSAAMLQEKVTEKDWMEKLSTAHASTGKLLERTEDEISYSTSAPESPDGEYVTLVYISNFEGAKEVTETVTVMLDAENRWRVAGYFIQ